MKAGDQDGHEMSKARTMARRCKDTRGIRRRRWQGRLKDDERAGITATDEHCRPLDLAEASAQEGSFRQDKRGSAHSKRQTLPPS
jgi:hypothetical protein